MISPPKPNCSCGFSPDFSPDCPFYTNLRLNTFGYHDLHDEDLPSVVWNRLNIFLVNAERFVKNEVQVLRLWNKGSKICVSTLVFSPKHSLSLSNLIQYLVLAVHHKEFGAKFCHTRLQLIF